MFGSSRKQLTIVSASNVLDDIYDNCHSDTKEDTENKDHEFKTHYSVSFTDILARVYPM